MKRDNIIKYAQYTAAVVLPATIAFFGATLGLSGYIESKTSENFTKNTVSKINIKPERPSIKKVTLKNVESPVTLNESLEQLNIKGDIPNLRVEVHKGRRILELFSGDKKIIAYRIGLGPSPAGRKLAKGDGKTPEGSYFVIDKNDSGFLPNQIGSRYIKINYPNVSDADAALKAKRISKRTYRWIASFNNNKLLPPQNTTLGGGLGIHAAYGANTDTKGCIGLNEKDLVEVFDVLKVGTPVTIKP